MRQSSSCLQHHTRRLLLRCALIATPLLVQSPLVFAHAEHDRARFVATTGVDTGRCDNPVRACRTIAYAVKHANKGDKVLVADGKYAVNSAEDLFLLTSQLVPVLGGFNKYDHFLNQAPQINPTILTNVPTPYVEQLQQQGFVVVNDGFAKSAADQTFTELMSTQAALQQSQGASACVNGKAGIYPCKNIDLVSHLALADFSSRPTAASDIWGHIDLNTGTEYAIIGLKNGTAVVSLADPAAPKEVGTIAGSNTSWRDIKVYQYFDATSQRYKAYAYISSEGADNLQIVDLNQLPTSIRLVKADQAVTSAHNVYISHVDYTTNTALDGKEPTLHIVGQKAVGGAFTTYGLKNPESLASYFAHSGATRADYTHDAASALISGAQATGCGTSDCTVLADFNEQSVRIWDISTLKNSRQLADFTYENASYVHSGWWTEDHQFVFVHDELDEQDFGLNTTVRVLNMVDVSNPTLATVWSGPSKAIDHNGYVRGNRYYISNYQRGTTILDITDPTKPVEVGYFDSFPSSDGAAFNGVWGTYPFLPSGLIISADINSGLYVLRDQTKTSTAGSVAFSRASATYAAGAPISLTVQRPNGSGAVSVSYETINAFGINSTAQMSKGQLSWAASENADKTITLSVPADSSYQQLFVRLFDPKNGLTLGTPSYQTITIGQPAAAAGSAGFVQSASVHQENGGSATLSLQRVAGSAGELRLNYQTENGTAMAGSDFTAASGQVIWADGDTANKTITIAILDDALLESDEQFKVLLTAVVGSVQTTANSMTLTIKDNEVNNAPRISGLENKDVNPGETVTLTALVSDADGDALTYQWSQLSGMVVNLQNPTSAAVTFVAPTMNGPVELQLIARDSRGATTTATVTLTVKGAVTPLPVPPPPVAEAEKSGGSWSLGWLSLLLLGVRRWPTISADSA